MCDFRFIETKTVFSFPNRQMGIPLVNNGPSQLAKYVGLMRATEITLTGKEISAHEAIEYGLASEATPDGTGRQIRSLNTQTLLFVCCFFFRSLQINKMCYWYR